MYLFENILDDETFNPIGNTFKYFIEILESFNKICYDVFQFGNVIMFLIFMFMSLNLLLSAREREYKEKINARNLMFQLQIEYKEINRIYKREKKLIKRKKIFKKNT